MSRYSEKEKQEVVEFVREFNERHGCGGQTAAKERFGINPISIKRWCVDAGLKFPKRTVSSKNQVTQPAPFVIQLQDGTTVTGSWDIGEDWYFNVKVMFLGHQVKDLFILTDGPENPSPKQVEMFVEFCDDNSQIDQAVDNLVINYYNEDSDEIRECWGMELPESIGKHSEIWGVNTIQFTKDSILFWAWSWDNCGHGVNIEWRDGKPSFF